jgi:hypothetical protein
MHSKHTSPLSLHSNGWVFSREVLPFLLIAAAFGPYLVGYQLRTEHLLIYLVVPFAFLAVLSRRRTILGYPPLRMILTCLILLTIWVTIVTTLSDTIEASPTDLLSHFENYTQPIAVLILVGSLPVGCTPARAAFLLRTLARTVVLALLLHSAFVFCSLYYDVSGIAHNFVGAPDTNGLTVWDKAESMGRHLGIFNQPFDNGVAYTLGVFLWGYLVRTKGQVSIPDLGTLAFLLVAAALSVSKVFLLVGLPLFIVYLLSLKVLRALVGWRLLVVGLAVALVLTQTIPAWTGAGYLGRLVSIESDGTDIGTLSLYTAGRFGSDTTGVYVLFESSWYKAPLMGSGFASERIVDNAYAEYFLQGGFVGLVLYLIILSVIGAVSLVMCAHRLEAGRLLLFIQVFVVIAGMGAPVITANRCTTIFWVLLAAIVRVTCAYGHERSLVGRKLAPEAAVRA